MAVYEAAEIAGASAQLQPYKHPGRPLASDTAAAVLAEVAKPAKNGRVVCRVLLAVQHEMPYSSVEEEESRPW